MDVIIYFKAQNTLLLPRVQEEKKPSEDGF